MINIEQTADDLFDKIRNRFTSLDIGDENGESCTENPKRARFFNFDFIKNDKNFGNITISIADSKTVKIFFDQNIDAKLDPEEKRIWFDWLKGIREFARSHIMQFDVRDISKSGLNLKDLKFLRRDTDTVKKDDVETSNVAESKLYGTSRSSYQKLENIRIIARHSKPIVDETVPGARSRNIESFYIENSQGERFRLPEGTTINGARAYARHIKNGGELYDDFSKHIGRTLKEMADLRMFVRNMRGRTFEDIETQQMVESAIDHYGKLHSNLLMLRSQRGYDQYKSLWQPDVLEEGDIDIAALRERFVKKIFDDRITDALPVVFREYNKRKMAVEQEFQSWATDIVREFEENPIDRDNKKTAADKEDIEEDEQEVNVKSPFANSIQTTQRDSEGNIINGDNEEERLASLLNSKQFEFRFEDGIYYFESRSEIDRAKNWIAKSFPKMDFPKMGVFDYGYGVYGSTTFDRELPNGKGVMEGINEDLRKWFKEKWVRFGPDGKIRGDCARGDESEGKPKCLPQAKAHALGKKGRKTAASRKRREDPNPERSGPAINVKTKESLAVIEGTESQYIAARYIDEFADGDHWYVKGTPDVIKKFVLLANSLEDEAVKGTEYEPDKGMMAKVHAQLGDDSGPQWTVVKAQNLEQLKPIGNRVLQLLMKPDLSYGAQEFMSEFLWTLEEKGLALVTGESQQGVAEGFTDDLDNIYAMHPQPEKSEQVVFLITGMNEDEFSNLWTDLPDPYQQEFGYDLPLWDADDLSSYPNLAVKRITFDQYVQLVGNYIKSEELAGSTMSKMKQGLAEGKHSCPECGGRLVEFSQLNEKKDACYYKVKSRYKVWPSAYASGALVKCRKKGAKNWGNKSESKLTPAAKLLDSFKTDLDKF